MSYQVCSRCIMDTSDPLITFNSEGVCNHCTRFDKVVSPLWFPNSKGKDLLVNISREIQDYGRRREYDCILGVSGGVDSSYLLHIVKNEMKLRPLAVHVDCGWNSELAVNNIERLIKKLDIDLFTYVVDWEEMKDLQLAFLRAQVANQDIPQDHAIFAKLYEFATKNDIKYVISGSNYATESILPSAWGYSASDAWQIKDIHKKYGRLTRLKSYPTASFFKHHLYYPHLKGMKVVRPLNWMPYSKETAIKYLESEYGWKYYGGKHYESRWTKFFQSYYLPRKFGYDKRRAHLSSLIVSGQMNREDALQQIQGDAWDNSEIKYDIEYVESKLGLAPGDIEKLISGDKKSYKDYCNQEGVIQTLKRVRSLIR